jgi:MFS family permease
VLIRTVGRQNLVDAMSLLTMPALIGPMLGAPLGGLIVTYADWRWIFFVNIPIGVLGIALATLFIPDVREETPPLDAKGFLLLASGFGGLILGTAMLGRRIAPPEVAAACIATGAITLPLYWRHAMSVPRPLLDVRLITRPWAEGKLKQFLSPGFAEPSVVPETHRCRAISKPWAM